LSRKVIIILVVFVVVLGTACGCGSNNKNVEKIDTTVAISSLVALADNHISNYANELEALAMTQEVQSGTWEEMKGLLDKVEKTQVPGITWFVLPDGSYYTVALDKTDKNLTDRAYFPGLMSGNKVLGDLVFSKATGKKSLIAASPVMKDGVVIGGLGASIFLDDLSKTMAKELDLPDNMVFYATTVTGEVVLHSDSALIILANPVLPKNVVFATSPLTGWRFALGFKD
jgi:hypothetical protein